MAQLKRKATTSNSSRKDGRNKKSNKTTPPISSPERRLPSLGVPHLRKSFVYCIDLGGSSVRGVYFEVDSNGDQLGELRFMNSWRLQLSLHSEYKLYAKFKRTEGEDRYRFVASVDTASREYQNGPAGDEKFCIGLKEVIPAVCACRDVDGIDYLQMQKAISDLFKNILESFAQASRLALKLSADDPAPRVAEVHIALPASFSAAENCAVTTCIAGLLQPDTKVHAASEGLCGALQMLSEPDLSSSTHDQVYTVVDIGHITIHLTTVVLKADGQIIQVYSDSQTRGISMYDQRLIDDLYNAVGYLNNSESAERSQIDDWIRGHLHQLKTCCAPTDVAGIAIDVDGIPKDPAWLAKLVRAELCELAEDVSKLIVNNTGRCIAEAESWLSNNNDKAKRPKVRTPYRMFVTGGVTDNQWFRDLLNSALTLSPGAKFGRFEPSVHIEPSKARFPIVAGLVQLRARSQEQTLVLPAIFGIAPQTTQSLRMPDRKQKVRWCQGPGIPHHDLGLDDVAVTWNGNIASISISSFAGRCKHTKMVESTASNVWQSSRDSCTFLAEQTLVIQNHSLDPDVRAVGCWVHSTLTDVDAVELDIEIVDYVHVRERPKSSDVRGTATATFSGAINGGYMRAKHLTKRKRPYPLPQEFGDKFKEELNTARETLKIARAEPLPPKSMKRRPKTSTQTKETQHQVPVEM